MATTAVHSAGTRTYLERILTQLRLPLRELGLSVSLWDAHGRLAGRAVTCSEFCHTVSLSGDHCAACQLAAAAQAASQGKPLEARSPLGCVVLAAPVRRRRRVEGVLVACFAPRCLAEGGDFARLCGGLKLDRQAMLKLAESTCRHDAGYAQDLLTMLALLVDREQSLQVARDELANLSANLSSTYEELTLLYGTSGRMKVTRSPREFLQNVCDELLEVMDVAAAAALVYPHLDASVEIVQAGQLDLTADQVAWLADARIAPHFVRGHRPVVENEVAGQGGPQAVRNLAAVPLATEERPLGMLIAFNKHADEFDSVDLKLLSSIGNLAAVFLENNFLYADLRDLLMGMLHSLTSAIDAKDPYTCGHSQRVALISKRLGEAMGFTAQRAQRVYLAGLLHDVGKIGVSEAVLCKPGRLTDDEYESVKKHPEIGARILGSIRQLEDVATWILTHHEWPDGRGYPRGLAAPDLPVEGQIVGLADGFDAMTSDRTYRKGMDLQEAAAEIRRCAGTQFGEEVAGAFLAMDWEQLNREMAQCSHDAMTLHAVREHKR